MRGLPNYFIRIAEADACQEVGRTNGTMKRDKNTKFREKMINMGIGQLAHKAGELKNGRVMKREIEKSEC